MVSWPTFFAYSAFSLRSKASFSFKLSSLESSKTTDALSRNSFFQLRSRFGRFGRKAADVLSSLQLMVQIMQKIDCIKEMGKL